MQWNVHGTTWGFWGGFLDYLDKQYAWWSMKAVSESGSSPEKRYSVLEIGVLGLVPLNRGTVHTKCGSGLLSALCVMEVTWLVQTVTLFQAPWLSGMSCCGHWRRWKTLSVHKAGPLNWSAIISPPFWCGCLQWKLLAKRLCRACLHG